MRDLRNLEQMDSRIFWKIGPALLPRGRMVQSGNPVKFGRQNRKAVACHLGRNGSPRLALPVPRDGTQGHRGWKSGGKILAVHSARLQFFSLARLLPEGVHLADSGFSGFHEGFLPSKGIRYCMTTAYDSAFLIGK